MHPQEQFCQNNDCPARGQIGKDNIRIHSRKDERYQCTVCKCTFTKTKGTVLYGLKKDQAEVIKIITLLAYGCPIPAIVVAFGLDVRTIRSWLLKAGQHCRGVHEHLICNKYKLMKSRSRPNPVRYGWLWQ